MKVCITVDMEHDCPPYFSTYRGIEEGAPRLFSLFKEEDIPGTFFTTGDVARKFPEVIRQLVELGHELGSHGDTHRRFDAMDVDSAAKEIRNSSETLRKHYPVVSFRAPNLTFPNQYLKILEDENYLLDSSQGKHKLDYYKNGPGFSRLQRIPVSTTSSVLRLPSWIRRPWLMNLKSPVVLFIHPWEFTDFTKEKLRLDCRFKTGAPALKCLEENIQMFKSRGAKFFRIKELIH